MCWNLKVKISSPCTSNAFIILQLYAKVSYYIEEEYEGLKTIHTIQIKNNYIIINFRAFTDVIATLSVLVIRRIKYHLNIIMHLTTLQPLKHIMFDIMFSIVLR